MRILHVLPWVLSGGVEKRRLLLAQGLDPARFEQRIFCQSSRGPLPGELTARGGEIEQAGPNWSMRDHVAARRLVGAIRRYRPHIVHAAVFEGLVLASMVRPLTRGPRLILEEIDFPDHRSWRADLLMVLLARQADRMVAVSHAVGDYFRFKLALPEERIAVLVNGVEGGVEPSPEEVRQARQELGGERPSDVVLATVGRLHDHHKRVSDVLQAFARADLPSLRLAVIGDGRDRAMLEGLAQALDLGDRVRFLGYRRDVLRLLHGADAFVLGSNRESFGQVLVEAMLAGLPVISTPVGGPSEIVVPHVTGFFVPVAGHESMAQAMRRLAEDPALRERLGRAGRARARQLFSAERYVADVARLYEDVLRGAPTSEQAGARASLGGHSRASTS
ncbi:MAG: glycosyltransferase [Sandaracinaceae bacterium]